MILKKFFGKTIEVAKKSARQMYGDDIVVLESFHPEDGKEAGVTVMVDTPPPREKKGVPKEKHSGEETPFRNVFYKRRDAMTRPDDSGAAGGNGPGSGMPAAQDGTKAGANGQVSRNLQALREYAAREEHGNDPGDPRAGSRNGGLRGSSQRFQNGWGKADTGSDDGGHANSAGSNAFSSGSTKFQPATLRKRLPDALRNGEQADTGSGDGPGATDPRNAGFSGRADGGRETGQQPSTRFESAAVVYGPPSPSYAAEASAGQQREITALHKRFDKLESLLDSALISSNLDYASHPSFQQLVRTGIKPTIIARWFRQIIETGIDPDEEPEQFVSGLSGIIRNALKTPADRPLSRHVLFTGPSGSGKTSLIMKLVQHPEFLSGKNIAVVSVQPDKKGQPYYTVLEPFCRDRNIPFHRLDTALDMSDVLETWKTYDHILIDTPAIPVAQERAFREYWKIRQLLVAATPLEVHYVINASLNRFYFRDSGSMHHPLQPDFVALTHLDEVSQWGPVIPFMEEMGCGARFMSLGADIPNGLREFSPAWFAQQVLQDT